MESFQNIFGQTIYKDQKNIRHYYFRRSKDVDNQLNGITYDGVLPQDRNYGPNDFDFTTTSDEAEEEFGHNLPYNPDLDFESTSEEEEN